MESWSVDDVDDKNDTSVQFNAGNHELSHFTGAQLPSVCPVQVRFIVSWVKTNGSSP